MAGQEAPDDRLSLLIFLSAGVIAVPIASRFKLGSVLSYLTVIDYSSAQLEMLRAYNVKVYYGDATRPDLLHAAGIDEAKVFIIAIDDREHITALTEYAVST